MNVSLLVHAEVKRESAPSVGVVKCVGVVGATGLHRCVAAVGRVCCIVCVLSMSCIDAGMRLSHYLCVCVSSQTKSRSMRCKSGRVAKAASRCLPKCMWRAVIRFGVGSGWGRFIAVSRRVRAKRPAAWVRIHDAWKAAWETVLQLGCKSGPPPGKRSPAWARQRSTVELLIATVQSATDRSARGSCIR